jgi:hypothetical protein
MKKDYHRRQSLMDKKKVVRVFIFLLVAALALASCEMPGLTSNLKQDASAQAKQLAPPSTSTTKIYCTASIPPDCFFFEFDLDGPNKTARVLLPLASNSYIQGDKVLRYNPIEYPIIYFYYDPISGAIVGQTAVYKGVSYSFQGSYSADQGFFGYITKSENGIVTNGLLGGVPVFPGSGMSNYVGEATYLFPTTTPQKLIFNVAFNPEGGVAYGTWCESGVGWKGSIHGTISGTGNAKEVHISAIPLPIFYAGDPPPLTMEMSAAGDATFKNSTMRDISGTFNITYGILLPSLLTATKETR